MSSATPMQLERASSLLAPQRGGARTSEGVA